MKGRNITNTLMFKLMIAVTAEILALSVILHFVSQSISEQIFINVFTESQQKIFDQIDEQFYKFYGDVLNISNTICSSDAVKRYLTEQDLSSVEERGNIFYMQQEIASTRLSDYTQLNVILIGTGGKNYVYNWTDILAVPAEDMLVNEVTRKSAGMPGQLVCEYQDSGYSDVTKSEPVIVMAQAIYSQSGHILGYLYIAMKEVDFRGMYEHFTSSTSDIVVMNGEGQILSSNEPAYLEKGSLRQKRIQGLADKMQEEGLYQEQVREGNTVENVLFQKLRSKNYHLIGVINPSKEFAQNYNMAQAVIITMLVAAAALLGIILIVRQQTKPLARLVGMMQNVRGGNLDECTDVRGTAEIRELTTTYNQMIRREKDYIQKLIEGEKEKRASEIHALQMQINPHYIYNTLASIKMLIWQENAELSTKVIDAFVLLLRNTISNTKELVTVAQEVENLKHYAIINYARYGEAVRVGYYVSYDCAGCMIPKLILQPFVENSFFHAYPEGQSGNIQVFARRQGGCLVLEVCDDGVGMPPEQLKELVGGRKASQKEHFTGIGINNVNNRIQLLYGAEYGVRMESREGKGTKAVITLPVQEKQETKEN